MTAASEPGVPAWATEMARIGSGVHAYVQGSGDWGWSNSGLIVGKHCAVVIDSLFTVPLTELLVREIRSITSVPVRYLVLTHYHGDHTFGAHLFGDATVVCHEGCRQEILRETTSAGQPDPALWARRFPAFAFAGVRYPVPDVTYSSRLTLHVEGREIQLLHYGVAHSLGDTVVYLPQERIVFGGDLLFLYSTPTSGIGSYAGWIDVLSRMADLPADTYVPGHGPVCGRDGVLESRAYLELISAQARTAFDAGLSSKEAALGISLGRFRRWAVPERILTNVERLYREFRGEPPDSPIDLVALRTAMREARERGTFA